MNFMALLLPLCGRLDWRVHVCSRSFTLDLS
jgi:hypothetical protein